MKTPDEIKKALACDCDWPDCEGCAYAEKVIDEEFGELTRYHCSQVYKDALAYIQHLESRLSEAGLKLNPLERQGLYGKYTVINNATGKRVEDCFVLRPFKDPVAWKTVRFYADHTDNKQLATDLYKWAAPLPLNAKDGADA